MPELNGFQKKHLRGLAHRLPPVVYLGQKGVTDAVCDAFEQALVTHELVKVKFVENKEKATKQQLCAELEKRTGKKPLSVINLHIADMIASGQKPTPEEIENYRLQEKDVEQLTEKVVSALQEHTAKPPFQC